MEESPIHKIIWQVVAPDEAARRRVERLLQANQHLVIHRGALPGGAQLGVVRDAISISEREQEVLEALLACDHNQEIAGTLGISRRTVDSHLHSMMQQFGVASRHRLVAKALLSGVLAITQNTDPENR